MSISMTCWHLLATPKKRFTIPRCTKEIGRTPIKYKGPLVWNSLPLNNRSIENFHTFKKSLKRAKESIKLVSFLKEASMITLKRTDNIYFLASVYIILMIVEPEPKMPVYRDGFENEICCTGDQGNFQ